MCLCNPSPNFIVPPPIQRSLAVLLSMLDSGFIVLKRDKTGDPDAGCPLRQVADFWLFDLSNLIRCLSPRGSTTAVPVPRTDVGRVLTGWRHNRSDIKKPSALCSMMGNFQQFPESVVLRDSKGKRAQPDDSVQLHLIHLHRDFSSSLYAVDHAPCLACAPR